MYVYFNSYTDNKQKNLTTLWVRRGGALKKAWQGYKIAKVQSDHTKMVEYAKKIRTLQNDLGVNQAEFPELNLH